MAVGDRSKWRDESRQQRARIDMGSGIGYLVDEGSGTIVCLSSMTSFPNESFLLLLSGMSTYGPCVLLYCSLPLCDLRRL